ncbi:MAG: type II secretion system secretin GspD [Alphaproteobacteria bacterium]|nr:type II secretion system secretin GspD [Alphaproteobacteria bacterium]
MNRRLAIAGAALMLAAACTAQPVRDVSELPVSIPETGPRITQNQTAPPQGAQPVFPASTAGAIARQPRIDELYPAQTAATDDGGVRPLRSVEGDITLNFDNADVREVARVILGNLLGLNYIVDPNVAGAISLASGRPLRRDDLLPTLEAILASQGIQLVNYGNVLRLTRLSDAQARAGGGISFGPGTAYRVFPLQYVAAAQLQTVLAPLLPAGAVPVVDSVRNLVVVAGDSTVMRLAAGTIEIFDVDRMATQTSAIVTLEDADATVVAAELVNIFAATGSLSGSDGDPGALQLIPIERMNGILVVGQNRDLVENAREWIFRLDRKRDPAERRVFVYYVQHGGAERIATALNEILGNGGAAAPAAGDASDTAATPAGLLDSNLRISVDSENNALLVSTTTPNFTLIQDVLQRLDIQPLQVMIETSIFEVSLRDDLRYGVQYAINNGGIGIGEGGSASFTNGTNTVTGPGSATNPVIGPVLGAIGTSTTVGGFNFTIEGASATRFIIDALSDLTEVNMISSPNVIVLNNNTASLNVGDEVPIITQSTTSTVTTSSLIVNTVQYRPTGVSLEVTPQVNASGMVTLRLSQSVSDVRVTTSSTINSPTIQNRSLLSTVSVRSGDTVLLGGLIRETAGDGRTGIPILHELPIIGNLFGRTAETTQRSELVILIRPIIISTPEEATSVTQSMRNKFLSLVRQEREGIRQPRSIPGAGR